MAGTPTQYITGHQEFWGLDILVNPSVLIPRPETEHIVERALQVAADARSIADCGTGSGCIALALASELPKAHIAATDLSLPALQTAKANAARLNLRVTLACADLLSAFPDACFDLVVSNPPYIALSDAPTLAREVRDHEPAMALFAGPNAAAVYRRLIPESARTVRPGGWVILELGYNVADAVRELLTSPEWHPPDTDRDLAGIERVIYARRAST
jgi:release factor glutamine methyltransferase